MPDSKSKDGGRTVTAAMIYDQTTSTKQTAQEILERLTEPREDEPDPMDQLLTALQEILAGQAVILKRLDAIERKVGSTSLASGRQ